MPLFWRQSDPKNWKSTTSTRKSWAVWYRFYDPSLAPKGKLVTDRSFNWIKDIEKRKTEVACILLSMEKDVEKNCYNPVTNERKPPPPPPVRKEGSFDPDMTLIEALQLALTKKKGTRKVKIDLKSVLKYFTMAAQELDVADIALKNVRRRHIKEILEHTGEVKERLEEVRVKRAKREGNPATKKVVWSANNFNFYRSYIMMLFEQMVEWDGIENNPVEKIKRMKTIKRKRATLSDEERSAISEGLRRENYKFWRLINVFFDSGARETEMALVKYDDVNLAKQEITYTIMKGAPRQEPRPISVDYTPLWREILNEAKPGQYLFSKNLLPGGNPISSKNLFTRRWKRWVKERQLSTGEKKYGEELADIYSLKHSHSTEVARQVGTKLAALHNQHTEAILKSNYDVQGDDRNMAILKGLNVPFA